MSLEAGFGEDFLDMLHALVGEGVEFLVVGAHAMAVHGVPRATGDLDLFVRPGVKNARRILQALEEFGAPMEAHGITREDFQKPGTVYQVGLPPRRIDLMTSISGLEFEDAWSSRTTIEIQGLAIGFLGRKALIENKRATGRDKDKIDIQLLSE